MYFPIILMLIVRLSTLAKVSSAFPLEDTGVSLVKSIFERQYNDRICSDQGLYTTAAQAEAFQLAQSCDLTGTAMNGSNGIMYPKEFKNSEDFHFLNCADVDKTFQEFPILPSGRMFGGDGSNDPGSDRIIYKITNSDPASKLADGFIFCGVITYIEGPNGGFIMCPKSHDHGHNCTQNECSSIAGSSA